MTGGTEGSPMDRTTAENLLSGDPLPPRHPLTGLLAAARAPATARELAGEAAATAAFRAAAHTPAHPRRSRWSAYLGRLLSLKVAAAAFATTATVGGVALSANHRSLPVVEDAAVPVASASASASVATAPRAAASPAERLRASAAPTTAAPATATATATVDALCREFAGRFGNDREQALDDDHFRELVRQAGMPDSDRIERFCRNLPRPGRSGQPGRPGPAPQPSRGGGATGWPFGDHDSGGTTRPDRPRPGASSSQSRR